MGKKYFPRVRVDKLLEKIKQLPLMVITATPGWGKTTALRAFFASRRLRCLWVTLTSGDELLFWNRACRSYAEFSIEGAEALASVSFPKSDIQAAKVLDILRERAQGDLYVVIDDYHLFSDESAIHDFIHTVVLNEPAGIHLILASRTLPPINVTELTAKELAFVVTNSELAFTREETESFLVWRGLRLSENTAAKIYEASAGWASALFLMSAGIKNGLGVSDITEIGRLINENFIQPLDEQTQLMLVSLSSTDSFTESLAAYVTRSEEIIPVIKNMAKYHALTAVDSYGTYTFHTLLREHLAKRRSPALYREACRRSALWYKKSGDIEQCLLYLLRAGEIHALLEELNRPLHPYRRFVSEDLMGLFYTSLDDEALAIKYPFPYLHIIFLAIISGNGGIRRRALRLLDIMEEYYKKNAVFEQNRILGECRVLRYFRSRDVGTRISELEAAKEYFGEEKCELLFKNDPFTFSLPTLLYSMHKKRGALDATVCYLQYRALEEITDGLGHGKDRLALAEAAIERCHTEEAKRQAEQALLMASDAGQTAIAAAAAFVMIRAELCNGNINEAKEWFERIRAFPEEFNAGFDDFNRASYAELTRSAEGYMYACLGMADKIPCLLKTARENGGKMKNGYGFFSLIRARAALLMGHYGDAETICRNCADELKKEFCQLGLINTKITLAAAKFYLGEPAAAAENLSDALYEAKADGITMPFAENYRLIRPVLEEICEKQKAHTDFLASVIRACRMYHGASSPQSAALTAQLTARELEALSLAAQGKTQKETAEAMGVKTVTAKKHLISAYRKLGAVNKMTAVKSAVSLGIIFMKD